ncbi:MAG: carboxymuconolactone decarboxylase family protein [Nevskiales bacterium]|nr:carboxymuconolactone decarboxylase family protein [Nevskiales bacterium]
MTAFTLHTPASAPEAAKTILEDAQKRFGFVPNLYAGLAESPAAFKGYLGLGTAFSETQLSQLEQNVVWLAVSVANQCEFCVAAHSFIAKMMAKADPALVVALREEGKLPDPKLNALAQFTRAVVHQRGWIETAQIESFLAAGYTKANVLDVILGVAMKTLSNYANHVMQTPLNDAFASERWQAPKK